MSRYLGSTQDVSNPVLAEPVVQSEPLLDCPSSALRILILNLLLFSAIKNQAERRKEKMATLARICRRLPLAFSTTLPGRAFSAQAAQSAENPTPPAPVIRESPDRVKWDYRGQRKIIPLGQWAPKIAVDAYVAPNVVLAGQVVVYDGASVWNGAVLRGDLNKITVGFCSNVQERCVIHAAWSSPTGQIFDSVGYTLYIDGCTFGFTFCGLVLFPERSLRMNEINLCSTHGNVQRWHSFFLSFSCYGLGRHCEKKEKIVKSCLFTVAGRVSQLYLTFLESIQVCRFVLTSNPDLVLPYTDITHL
ncbi:Gamma carbonic anhydrase-like 2, mitochondrial [Sesamum angolense]|uniref:Gamma carbonic anhydrase-like 2, mitochondrial n=1 Tax=Sesamum angolense TaxID=2727404 RepID=A0AAE2BRZ2_9LAMI|nr:Gamma carbonic anhydrase-like 2, mitochondrial [Sesamum angolense]